MAYVPNLVAARDVVIASSNTTLTKWNSIVMVDATAGPVTITLPTAVGALQNGEIQVVKTDASNNAVIIDGNAAETVNGAATISLLSERQTVSLASDNANVVAVDDAFVDFRGAVKTVTANYTATKDDETIYVNAAGGPVTVTLPVVANVATASRAKKYTVKKMDATTNAVSIARSGADTIEAVDSSPPTFGASTSWLVAGAAYTFVSDAANTRYALA